MSAMVRPPTADVLVASLETIVLKMIPVNLSVLTTPVCMEVPARRHSVTRSAVCVPLGLLERDANGWPALQMETLFVKMEEHAIKFKISVL